jgi:glycosyltransferase involved in cell wall biosynthesis
VIASAIGAIPHGIKHGVNGIIVPPSNPKVLAKAIIEIFRNPKKAKTLGANGHKNVATWPDVARMLEKAYFAASKH